MGKITFYHMNTSNYVTVQRILCEKVLRILYIYIDRHIQALYGTMLTPRSPGKFLHKRVALSIMAHDVVFEGRRKHEKTQNWTI